jgi:hypothetical protein
MEHFEPGTSESNKEPTTNEGPVQTSQVEVLPKLATGPRTPAGKVRSKKNAVSHGIFTAGILKGVERKADHARLVEELRDHFQAQGPWEELLLEKMAMILMRQGRVLIAESAEILREHGGERLRREALDLEDRINSKSSERGLMEFLDNRFVLARCTKLVTDWRERVSQRGYDAYFDFALMRKLYGRCPAEELDKRTQEQIKTLSSPAVKTHPGVRSDQEKHEFQEKQCKDLLSRLDDEIEYLKHTKSVFEDLGRASRVYEQDCQLVPRAEILDRLIRYEAHLNRQFDHAVNQLERSIRMRLGHRLPPSINIEIEQ